VDEKYMNVRTFFFWFLGSTVCKWINARWYFTTCRL